MHTAAFLGLLGASLASLELVASGYPLGSKHKPSILYSFQVQLDIVYFGLLKLGMA